MLLWVVGVGVIAAVAWRVKYMRGLTRLTMSRRVLGADGIVIGGEGFVLDRADAPAVLLLHGAGDTPQTLRYLATRCMQRGFHVAAPLLPGHGRRVREFARVTARRADATRPTELSRPQGRHEWVAVIGLSMGGALAAQLAASVPELPALGLVAPYLGMPPRVERAARFAWLWGFSFPRCARAMARRFSIRERERNLAYGVFTAAALRALREMMRRALEALPRVAAPTLIIQSRKTTASRVPTPSARLRCSVRATNSSSGSRALRTSSPWTTAASGHWIARRVDGSACADSLAVGIKKQRPARGRPFRKLETDPRRFRSARHAIDERSAQLLHCLDSFRHGGRRLLRQLLSPRASRARAHR